MTLSVIGAGMGRNGTYSLKLALERLGYAPCHHMKEVIASDQQKRMWRAVVAGETADWDRLYAGYRAAVDWPTCHYWRELAAHYPEARVILATRAPEAWYQSVANTISRGFGPENDPNSVGRRLIGETVFGGRFADKAHAIAVYERHNEAVRKGVPAGRLLDYQVSQGWEPLCSFLGVPVPDEPFPHHNTTDEFKSLFPR